MISILDPTTIFGRDLLKALARRYPTSALQLFHTGARGEHLVADVGGEPRLVLPLNDPGELGEGSAVVVTAPIGPPTSLALLAWLAAHPDVALIDLAQPGLTGEVAATVLDRLPSGPTASRWYHLPDPAVIGPARMLQALAALGPDTASVVVTRPVSIFGEDAVHELAVQAAARLSGAKPPRAGALAAPIAFDLAAVDENARFELSRQLGVIVPGVDLVLLALDAGVFHGHTAAVTVHCTQRCHEAEVRSLLRAAPGLTLARRSARLHIGDVTTLDGVMCGGVQVHDRTVAAWLVLDGLRTGAAEVAVDLLAAISALQ
jgi:Semialdehyde dehydrogenase, dimerisation domain